jgi:hypothetical protein
MQLDKTYEQHINVLKHFVNAKDGWGKQFELAVSLKHDIIILTPQPQVTQNPKI